MSCVVSNPWSLSVEPTWGCNRFCDWCGIQSVHKKGDKNYKFMSVETADLASRQLAEWLPKVRAEFTGSGEPLLNPNIVEIVSAFRRNFPKIQILMTTNGDNLFRTEDFVKRLFDAGMNCLLIDVYEQKRYPKLKELLGPFGFPIYDYYDDEHEVFLYRGHDHKEIVLLKNIAYYGKPLVKSLCNHGGALPFSKYLKYRGLQRHEVEFPLKSPCSQIFRDLPINYDGTVSMCCVDFKKQVNMGSIYETNIKDIWQGNMFNYLRYFLRKKNREFPPCCICDYLSKKIGLVGIPEIDVPEEEAFRRVKEFLKFDNVKNVIDEYTKDGSLMDFLAK